MADIVINKQNIETGTRDSINSIRSRYVNPDAVRASIVNNGYAGLKVSNDVQTVFKKTAQTPGFGDQLYGNTGKEVEGAVKGYAIDMGEKALEAQKALTLTLTKEMKALVAQGYTIEQAMIQVVDGGKIKVYVEKTTGLLIRTETIMSETTHIPVGKILSGSSKMLGAYGTYESIKQPIEDAYRATTGAGSKIEPLKSQTALSVGTIVGGLAGGAATPFITPIGGLAVAGLVGAGVTAVTKTVLDAIPQMIDAAKAAGKSLAEVYKEAEALIAQKYEEAYNATGTTAQNFLNDAEKYLNGLADGMKQLADDYDWPLSPDSLPEALRDMLPDWVLPPGERMGQAPLLTCPLVLDLDGDGIETTGMGVNASGSKTYFDIDNDGFAERTGWVTGGDGLLAIDRNVNGKIDNQGELFGNTATYADGFASLAALDTNKDGKISSGDTDWSKLRVWIDADGDGVTDAGELKTLAELKITQINLNPAAQSNVFNNENSVTATSTFVMNGQTKQVADVWFRNDQMDTQYRQDVSLNTKTIFLPTLKGFGNIKDLHVAMSLDETLLTAVENFVKNWNVTKLASQATLDAEVQNILFKWAGVDTVVSTSRGQYIDAKILTFMEKLTGQAYGLASGIITSQPDGPFQAAGVTQAYKMAFDALKAQLIVQAGASSLFATAPAYDFVSGELNGGVLTAQSITALKTAAAGATDKDAYWKTVTEFLLNVKDSNEFTAAEKSVLDTAVKTSNAGLSWDYLVSLVLAQHVAMNLNGTTFSDNLVGTLASDSIQGQAGNDIIKGRDGNDSLYGGEGNDVLTGGAGNDTLRGDNGNDTYIYTAGDGVDNITDYGGTDVLKITGTYTTANITIQRPDLYSLDILLNGQLIAKSNYQFYYAAYGIESIVIDNGTSINLSGLKDVQGTEGAETLSGFDNALLKDDVIYGYGGNDTLDGKIGNDILYGGSGNDKYIYSNGVGQGTDRIRDDDGTADSISLGSSYTSSNVTLERVGQYDLAIKSVGQTLMLIEGQFNGSGSIETLVYGNGSTLNLLTYSHTVNGTAAGDNIYGTSYGAGGDKLNGLGSDDSVYAGAGNDTVTGGDGNDYLNGEDGDDTLSGNAGDDYVNGGNGNDTIIYESGLDRISDYAGTDVISITNSAITAANMTLRRNIGNQGDLDILLNGTHAFTIQGQFYQNQAFETIKFANATTYNLLNVQYTSTGTSGSDSLYGISYGGNPNDIMDGGAGNDYLYGYEGNDTLDGGTGVDRLYGGNGNDIYKISLNAGVDTINDSAGTDTIQFGTGFSNTNMTVQRDAVNKDNLNILFGGVLAVTVEGHFRQGSLLETLKFSDNSTYDLASVSFTQNGTANSDTLYGYDGIDIIKGAAGDDYIYAYAGSDTLEGEAGTDYLYGGAGDDTYLFGTGFGGNSADYVSEEASQGTDTVKFTTLKSTDVYSWSDWNGYYIQSKTNAKDLVNVYGYVNNGSHDVGSRVEKISFADGVTWNLAAGLISQDSDQAHSMYGSSLADSLKGNGGDDSVYGHAGNDTLEGGTGTDYLYGGAGDDTYLFGTGFGGTYADYVSEEAFQGTDTVKFTTLKSTDVYSWSDWNGYYIQSKINPTDLVNIYGYVNNSSHDVGARVEKVIFSDGVTWNLAAGLIVQDSDQTHSMYGSSLADNVKANGGDDSIYSYAGNDTLEGGAGTDYLYGGAGDDTYLFGSGFGGAYADYVSEEATQGADTVKFTTLKSTDVHSWSDWNGYYIQSKTNPQDLINVYGYVNNGSHDVGTRVEKVTFSDGVTWNLATGLIVQDSDEAHTMYGSSLADSLKGNGGDDSSYGYAGNDTLEGGAGTDYLYGGAGDDTYLFGTDFGGTYADYVSEEASQGTDTVKFTTLKSTDVYSWSDWNGYYIQSKTKSIDLVNIYGYVNNGSHDAGVRVEKVSFADGVIWNLAAGLIVQDSDESHSMYGSSSADKFKANGGSDSIYAYAGNDTLEGGTGTDYLYGGLGNDIYLFGTGFGMDYISDDGGVDTLKLGTGFTTENISISDYSSYDTKIIANAGVNEIQIASQRYTGNANTIESLQFMDGFKADLPTYNSWIWGATTAATTNGTANADTVFGRGGNDTINGNAGNDALHGGSGDDVVKGGDGNDQVNGGIGADTLYGDAGNDILYGDDGADKLYGGAGADMFMFLKETAFKNIETIYDFSKTESDQINIADLLQGYDPLTKAITDWVQITDSGSNSILKIDVDGGANNFVQIATLNGVTGLTDEQALMTSGHLVVV